MADSAIRRKLVALLALRLVSSTLLLGTAVFIQLRATPSLPPSPLYALIGWTFALSAAYAITLRLAERHRWLIDLQLALDALTVSAFVWMTGGIASYFSSLYVLPIIAASTLQHRRGAMLVATFSLVLYVGLVMLQYSDLAWQPWTIWAPGQLVVLPSNEVARYTVAINALGFLGVALLSGSLAERVRRADLQLADASTAIADLQAFNQHVIDSLTMGLVTTDLSGRVLTFNRAAEEITGHPAQTVIGTGILDVLQLPAEFAAGLDTGFQAPGSRRADFRYRRAGGPPEIDLGLSATHLVTSSGRSGLLFTFQDVTMLKKLERDALVQQRLAAVGEMAAGLAHEIRNPLASMSGSIQILRDDLQLSDEQAQLMDIVLRESERLNQTIRSFLAYARPQRFSITRIDLWPILQDAALLLRNSAEVRDHHRVDVDPQGAPVWCDADEGQVRQIVWNLATNGLRAMPRGGRLRLAARQAGTPPDLAALMVQDEGVGIPEDELDAIFQPFHGSFSKGSGLGMAIVHRIVSDYGGEIKVTSQPGAGTTVEVLLPARAAGSA
ncbi:MAG: ATP-binding protein [Acidobacteriota bacterium]